jgi:hypothetical protein
MEQGHSITTIAGALSFVLTVWSGDGYDTAQATYITISEARVAELLLKLNSWVISHREMTLVQP